MVAIVGLCQAHPMPTHLIKQHKSVDNVHRRQLYHVNQTVFREPLHCGGVKPIPSLSPCYLAMPAT